MGLLLGNLPRVCDANSAGLVADNPYIAAIRAGGSPALLNRPCWTTSRPGPDKPSDRKDSSDVDQR